MNRHALLAAIALIVSAASAEAGVRNFFSPLAAGDRVDACLPDGSCGKSAADAFCKAEGYDRAVIFQREPVMKSRVIGGALCEGQQCTAFKQVKCFTTKTDLAALP